MNTRQAFYGVLVVLTVVGLPSVVGAWDYPYGLQGCAGYWYPPSSFNVEDTVPYFILHPPVYYSHVIRRPYGLSPFPYPPYVLTSERRPVGALVESAPCAPCQLSKTTAPGHTKPTALRIQNPFVTQTAGTVPGTRAGVLLARYRAGAQ